MTDNSQSDKPSQPSGGMAMAMQRAGTRGDATVRDLRTYSCHVENPTDRELIQHAADMIEVFARPSLAPMNSKEHKDG